LHSLPDYQEAARHERLVAVNLCAPLSRVNALPLAALNDRSAVLNELPVRGGGILLNDLSRIDKRIAESVHTFDVLVHIVD